MGTKRDSLQQKRAALKKKKRETKRKTQRLPSTYRESDLLPPFDDSLLAVPAIAGSEAGQKLHISTIKITYNPIKDASNKKIPADVKDRLEELYYLCQDNPQQAIEPLEELKQKYPDIPRIYNYLMAAYLKTGDSKKADEVAIENYQKHSDYLFARVNYAEYCLRHGNINELYTIFDNKFDLTLLYPERKEFHISEAVSFYGIMGLFFLRTGDKTSAQSYYKLLKKLEPEHPTTKALEKELFLSRIMNFFDKELR